VPFGIPVDQVAPISPRRVAGHCGMAPIVPDVQGPRWRRICLMTSGCSITAKKRLSSPQWGQNIHRTEQSCLP